MKAKDAVRIINRIIGIESLSPIHTQELEAFLTLLMEGNAPKTRPMPKEAPNEIKQEENTISLDSVEHFELPKEFNLQMEGDDHLQKIKIFPDGISEEPAEPPAAAN